jgi:hypothetical protein
VQPPDLLPNGDLLLFENGNFHNPPERRAVEYRLETPGPNGNPRVAIPARPTAPG